MLIFESSYDNFMILSYDKVWSQISVIKLIYLNCFYVTHYAFFYVMRAVKMFYFVEIL